MRHTRASSTFPEASFFLTDSEPIEDLNNKRKKWIRFNKFMLSEIIGELSYCYNRSKNNYESIILDELIVHLEYYEEKKLAVRVKTLTVATFSCFCERLYLL